jgi:hypothetical protein
MSGLIVPLDNYGSRTHIEVDPGDDGTVLLTVSPEMRSATEPFEGSVGVERILSPDDALALAAALTHHAREALGMPK